jgi:hypothetical protein
VNQNESSLSRRARQAVLVASKGRLGALYGAPPATACCDFFVNHGDGNLAPTDRFGSHGGTPFG